MKTTICNEDYRSLATHLEPLPSEHGLDLDLSIYHDELGRLVAAFSSPHGVVSSCALNVATIRAARGYYSMYEIAREMEKELRSKLGPIRHGMRLGLGGNNEN